MKRPAATLILLTLASAFGIAQGTSTDKTGEEVRKLDARRFAAMTRADIKELEIILSDDLTYTHSTGMTETKKEFLASLQSGNLKYLSLESDESAVRTYGMTAVITGRAKVKVLSRGQEQAFTVRYIDVYAKKNGKWQMVAWQSSRLP